MSAPSLENCHCTDTSNATEARPWSSQFLDGDEAAAKARRIYIKILAQRTCVILVALFAIFSIYWGALCKIPARKLEAWIVDFDEGTIGTMVTRDLAGLSSKAIHWRVHSASEFPNGASDLADAVFNEQCWVAVSINAGATQALGRAMASKVDASYNASSAITAYGIEARNENVFRAFIKPTVERWLQEITYNYSLNLLQELASNSSVTLSSISPSLLVRPIYYTFDNIRPFDVPVAAAVTFVSLINLLVLAFFILNSAVMARTVSGLDKRLTLGSLVRVRLASAILIYLVISCFYSLLSLAFRLPFHRRFERAGFVLFWMISWFGMMAVGLALEAMITLLTIKYVQLFLIFWIISNISVCLWPIDLLPRVYRYGHVAPFYQISRTVRTIVFGTRDEVGLNFGVLTAWIIISCVSLPMIQWYRRREEVLAWQKQEGKDEVES